MRILIAANQNKGYFSPFVIEQAEAIKRLGVDMDFFGLHGKGVWGYLKNRKALIQKIQEFRPDIIHAHYGLIGLLANLQRSVPVVTTYHGSDIHSARFIRFLSRLAIRLSAYNIFVSRNLMKRGGYHGNKQAVIACGVDFYPVERDEARKLLGWDINGKYVLFAGAFDNIVKNSPLAKAAIAEMGDVQLKEMKGLNREQVNLAMNAANCLLVTSFREGAPMVVKEAMACGTPVVSVRVGDVEETTKGVDGCYLAMHDAHDIAVNLQRALSFQGKTDGRKYIIERGYTQEQVAQRILEIYKAVIRDKANK